MPKIVSLTVLKDVSYGKVRTVVVVIGTGFLAACASHPDIHAPTSSEPVVQQAENYRAHAKSYYAPPGTPDDPWGPYIHEASSRFDVPEKWIRAVINRESGGRLFDRNGNFVTSVPGAMGLMQLMPPTYDDMRLQNNLNDDPFDPHDNILAGTAYIRQMYDIYGSPGFLAAYNDGPGSLDRYLRRKRPLPRETRRYVASIGPQITGYWPHNRSAADLLVAQHDSSAQSLTGDDSSADSPDTADASDQTISAAWAQKQHSLPSLPSSSPSSSNGNNDRTDEVAVVPPATSDNVSAAWAAHGVQAPSPPTTHYTFPKAYHPPSGAANSDQDVSDARVVPQVIPVGHRLHAQSIVAEIPSSRLHYRLAPSPGFPSSPTNAHQNAWSIQVGAYAAALQASEAASRAKEALGHLASGSTTQIVAIQTNHGKLYRARLTGFDHVKAATICHHLANHAACVIVPPGSF